MAYSSQQYRHELSDTVWLTMLVETFENSAQDVRKPCDADAIAAVKAQLARPAALASMKFDTAC